MNKPRNPLMLAYIIFLFICTIYYIICEVFKLEFNTWEHLVVAVTISSYFFTLSTAPRNHATFQKKHIDFLNKNIALLTTVLEYEKETPTEKPFSAEDKKDIEKEIEDCRANKKQSKKFLKTCNILSFSLEVIGYLTFFCICTFDFIYKHLFDLQELLTVFAFLIILIIDYSDGILIEKQNKILDSFEKTKDEILCALSEECLKQNTAEKVKFINQEKQ